MTSEATFWLLRRRRAGVPAGCQFGGQAGVSGRVGLAGHRVGAADRGGRLADRFQRRRRSWGRICPTVIPSSCCSAAFSCSSAACAGAMQLRQLDVGVFVERLSAACAERRRALWRRFGIRSCRPSFSCRPPSAALLWPPASCAGPVGELVERVDRLLRCRRPPGRGRAAISQRAFLGLARAFGEQAGAVGRLGDARRAARRRRRRRGQVAAEAAESPSGPGLAFGGEQRRCPVLRSGSTRARDLAGADHGLHAGHARRCGAASGSAPRGGRVGDRAVGRLRRRRRRALRSRGRPSGRSVRRRGGRGRPGAAGRCWAGRSSARSPAPPSSRTTAPIRAATGAGRRRAARDQRHQPRALAVRRRADPPAVDVGAEQDEDRRADHGGDEDGEHDDHRQGPGQRGEQDAGDDEERDEHREQQRAAGEDRGAARRCGGSPRPRRAGRRRRPAPRGSGRPSAARSRPRAPAPSSCRR